MPTEAPEIQRIIVRGRPVFAFANTFKARQVATVRRQQIIDTREIEGTIVYRTDGGWWDNNGRLPDGTIL